MREASRQGVLSELVNRRAAVDAEHGVTTDEPHEQMTSPITHRERDSDMTPKQIFYETYPDLNALSDRSWQRISGAVECISKVFIAENAQFREQVTSLRTGDKGVVLSFADGCAVGFGLYERVTVGSSKCLYAQLTNILPEFQGRRIGFEMKRRFLLHEIRSDSGPQFVAWRTRNPTVWQMNTKICNEIMPDIFGKRSNPLLLALGRLVALQLYPNQIIETPSLIMHGIYPSKCCGSQQPHHHDSETDAAFFDVPRIAETANARFFIGELKSPDEIEAVYRNATSAAKGAEVPPA
jgi:hypothetical protein